MLTWVRALMLWLSFHPWRVGLSVGLVICVIGWFIQLVVLGLVLPEWSDGNGLIPGQDVSRFHRVAASQAELIAIHGWSAWELRPNGWGISGLMSAWYAVTVPHPWALVPLQAAMYGIGAAILANLIGEVTSQRGMASLSVLPMVLLPSAGMIYAQPHRDIVVFFGLLLTIQGFWWLARIQYAAHVRLAVVLAISGTVLAFSGFVVAWSVRAFSGEIFQGLAALVVVVISVFSLSEYLKTRQFSWYAVVSPLMVLLVLVAMNQFHSGGHFSGYLKDVDPTPSPDDATVAVDIDRAWVSTSWLPAAVDDRLRRLSGAREHFLAGYSHGRSAIDTDIHYYRVADMLLHTPRAVQVALFSPFPHQWLPHPEAEPVRNAYRVLGGAEMAVLYLVLPFLLYAGWCWWRRPAFWILLMPALAWVMVYAYTVPVVGSLVRYRFPGYIILVALAVAGLCQAVLHWRAARQARLPAVP
jgi:hypothetical protein